MSISFSQAVSTTSIRQYILGSSFFIIRLPFNIKGDRGDDAEETVLLSLGTLSVLAVFKMNQKRVVTIVEVINAKSPLSDQPTLADFLSPRSTHVKMMVVWSPVTIALGIVIDVVVDDLILGTGSRESLSRTENP